MRELKFRAWDKQEYKMVYDVDILANGNSGKNDTFISTHDEVMQYTGLKDKNGVEIYEGDIVDCWHYYDSFGTTKEDEHRIGVVIWESKNGKSPAFMVEVGNEYGKWTENFVARERMEVIGNIYENGDLLK